MAIPSVLPLWVSILDDFHSAIVVGRADTFVVWKEAGIRERGSHDDLIRAEGHYARLWQHQSDQIVEYKH